MEKIELEIRIDELEHNGNHYGKFFFSHTTDEIDVFGWIFYRCYDWKHEEDVNYTHYKLSLQSVSIENAYLRDTEKDISEQVIITIENKEN